MSYFTQRKAKDPNYRATRPDIQRRAKLKATYGITDIDYQVMFEVQNGVCAICKQPGIGRKLSPLDVDHDHDTSVVRGLLCISCNRAIAQAEKPGWLEAAWEYLYQQPEVWSENTLMQEVM